MNNNLFNIEGTLLIYLEPELFINDFNIDAKKGPNYKISTIKRYYRTITTVSWFSKKIGRYETYFANFYPDTNLIPRHEALEHHIHAYLEDIQTLRNKIMDRYLPQLSQDLCKIYENKKDVKETFKDIKKNVYSGFSQPSKVRSKHRHLGDKFSDPHLSNAESMFVLLNNPNMKSQLSKWGVQQVTQKENESFESGRQWWIQNTQKHKTQLDAVIDYVFGSTKEYLYTLLDIEELNLFDS